MLSFLTYTLNGLIRFLYPAKCMRCSEFLQDQGHLCLACWKETYFIQPPFCDRCGIVFEYDIGTSTQCGQCTASPPHYSKARAALSYNETARQLITHFKYYDKTLHQQHFAKWMILAGAEFLSPDQPVIIAPVPLHRKRLFKRRYNQANLLAMNIGQLTNQRVIPTLLKRKQATISQTGLSRKARRQNVQHAFAINAQYLHTIPNQLILLIDDVMTTGATLNACAKVLMQHGAKQVNVLTLARAHQ